nr:mucin-6-like isoform X1 [Paramormyrops kingsleyae]
MQCQFLNKFNAALQASDHSCRSVEGRANLVWQLQMCTVYTVYNLLGVFFPVIAVNMQDNSTSQPWGPLSLSAPLSGSGTMQQAEPKLGGRLFNTADEMTHLHGANTISSGNKDAIVSQAGQHVLEDGSHLLTESEDGPSGMKFALAPNFASIFNYEKAIFSSNAAGFELMMNGTLMTEAPLSNQGEKFSSPLQALLNRNNPRLTESITPFSTDMGRSMPMISIFETLAADKPGDTKGTEKKKDENKTQNGVSQLYETVHPSNGGILIMNDKVQLSMTGLSTENPKGLTSLREKQYTSTETFVSPSSSQDRHTQGQQVSIDASPAPHVWTPSAAMGQDTGLPASVHVASSAVLLTAVFNFYSQRHTIKGKQASVFNTTPTKSPLIVKDHSTREIDLVLKPKQSRELLFHMKKEQSTQPSTKIIAKTSDISKLVTTETLQMLHVTSESHKMSGRDKSTPDPLSSDFVSHIRHESNSSNMDNQTLSPEGLDSNLMPTEQDKTSALVFHSFATNALRAAALQASAPSVAVFQLLAPSATTPQSWVISASDRPAAPSPVPAQSSAPPSAVSQTPAPSAPASRTVISVTASQSFATLVASAQPSAPLKAAFQPLIQSATQHSTQSSATSHPFLVSDVPVTMLTQTPNELQMGTKVPLTQSTSVSQSSASPASPSLSSAPLVFLSHPSAPPADASLLFLPPATTFQTLAPATSFQSSTLLITASQTLSLPRAASQISVPSPAASNPSASPTGVSHIQPSAPSASPSQGLAPLPVSLHASAPSTPVFQPSASSAASEPSFSLKAATQTLRQSEAQHLPQSSAASQPPLVTVVPVKVPSLNLNELQIGTKVPLQTASPASPVATSHHLALSTVPLQSAVSSEIASLSLAHSTFASHPLALSPSSSQSSTSSISASSSLAPPTETSQILTTLWPSPQSTAQHLSQASAASQSLFVTIVPVTVPPLNATELQIGPKAQAKSTEASKFVKASSLWPPTPNVNVFMFVLSRSSHPKLIAANLDATQPPTIPLSPVTHPPFAPSTISAFAKLERQNLNRTIQTESHASKLTPARQELTLSHKLFSITTRNLPLRQSSTAKNNPTVTHSVASLEDLYRKDGPITFIELLSFNESEKGLISLSKQQHNRNNVSDGMQQSDDISTTAEYPFKTHNGNVHTKQDPLFKDGVYNATQNMTSGSPSLEKDLTERNKFPFSKIEDVTNVIVKEILRASGSVAQGKLSQFIGTIESPISPSKDLILTPAVVLNQPKEERGTLLIDRTVTGSELQQRFSVLPFTVVNRLLIAAPVTQPAYVSKHASSGLPHSSPERQAYRSTENKVFSGILTSPLPPTKSTDPFAHDTTDLPLSRRHTSLTFDMLKKRKQNAAVHFSQFPTPSEWLAGTHSSVGPELKNEPSEALERSSPSVQLQQSTPSPSKEGELRTPQAPTIQITGQRDRNPPGNFIKKLMEEAVRSEASLKAKRLLLLLDLFLSGLAEVSDDICGTGNHTANVILNLERELLPADSVPAIRKLQVVISVTANSSQENLTVTSCCVSPMPWAGPLNTICCLLSRLPTDPRVIGPLPGDLSESTSLAVHLYRVANSSVARLHRNISACPGTRADCEMVCG